MTLVNLHQDKIVVSTVDIANHFGKEHKKVLRAINNLQCSKEFKEANFLPSTYKAGRNIYSCFELTIPGLVLLLSSFTGSKVASLKEELSYLISQAQEASKLIQALNNFEIPDELPDMYLYVIKEDNTPNYKIGISKNPELRLKQLQTGNSSKLSLIYTVKAENRYKDETELHKIFEAYKIQGEWFKLESSL